MKKRTRTALFGICVFFFLLATPLVVLYSQGYRVDFGKKQFVQTGAFYCKVFPDSVEVYIDGKLQKRTSSFGNSAIIKNLLPKTYQIEIKKEGYYPWKKSLEIKEKEVAEAKGVILFPQKIDFTLVDEKPEIEKITMSATSSDKSRSVDFSDHEIWVTLETGEKVFLTRFSEKIGKVFWLTNNYLLFSVGDKIKIVETDDRDKLNMIDLAEFKNPEIYWQDNEKKLYVSSGGKLYLAQNLIP